MEFNGTALCAGFESHCVRVRGLLLSFVLTDQFQPLLTDSL
uniref:Uncharacterized protein n=1 Tax=Anguilla anguilla TaxID=7936 RepID=A0A0E9T0U0_ANGAN